MMTDCWRRNAKDGDIEPASEREVAESTRDRGGAVRSPSSGSVDRMTEGLRWRLRLSRRSKSSLTQVEAGSARIQLKDPNFEGNRMEPWKQEGNRMNELGDLGWKQDFYSVLEQNNGVNGEKQRP
ncbi:hypothetical protein CDL15_Pgr004362 [Punica granatum]|uniref:Uncharacterized protein n=1 Tax=Punica granatum TaxID=22663 RepID=A0A218XHJ6_PUNGR|nr:hypothetical protein CDL15_Pgr004362 [Punica granatum]